MLNLLKEAGLPHARFPGHADGGPFARSGFAQASTDPVQHRTATHQRGEESLAALVVDVLVRDQVDFLVDPSAAPAVVLAESDEIVGHLLGALVSRGDALHHGLEDDVLQLGGHLGRELPDRDGILVEDRVGHRDFLIAAEGKPAGQELVHHDAERVEIAPAVEVLADHLLRRHVGDGA